MTSPSPEAESEVLTDFTLNNPMIQNLFCKKCGVHAFHRGDIPEIGGKYVSVNVACLDDIKDTELAQLSVRYCDGLNNNWWNEPKEKSHL